MKRIETWRQNAAEHGVRTADPPARLNWKTVVLTVALSAIIGAIIGCGGSATTPTGGGTATVRLTATISQGLSGPQDPKALSVPTDIASVRLTVTGPNIAGSVVQTMTKVDATHYSATVTVPDGGLDHFLAEALASDGTTVIYSGSADSQIVGGNSSNISILLRETNPPTGPSTSDCGSVSPSTGASVSYFNANTASVCHITALASDTGGATTTGTIVVAGRP
ncbi:hypothetical protein [Anaeromyxobacter diazotrophicus]|uniref:Uncharacterized protein n=1 Tax=Anaeromyxobacter diazotrophicus TaxID=2590199 RepID=A0A7I9VKM6_9BACT|nr:hypothetical protein [Anaeromyxobacter diazotrophicus]GEJ56935.1 hypothetical protein AMYX_16760 [Anaeromyxobacter diazotrophicus]